ncbi:DC1 - like 10 [Theobroma cacao]|nr:DC1 - like 10 [Theobroma cacao]
MKSEGEELIQHFTHWHPLQLVLEKKKEEDQVCCFICQKLCSGSATAYGCKQCEFFLHNSCMTSIPRKINHFFHPCPLILLTSPFIYTCGGCDERGSFLTFSCGRSLLAYRCDKCEFTLDKDCAKLTPSFKYGPHPHLLTLIDKTDRISCDICRKKANNFCLRCVAYEQSRMSSRIISTDEENSEIDPVLAKLDEEIAKLREKAKPFKLEIESLKRLIQKLQARLQELEAKLEPITWGLDKLEEDRFLYMYELKHKMKGKHSIEASP